MDKLEARERKRAFEAQVWFWRTLRQAQIDAGSTNPITDEEIERNAQAAVDRAYKYFSKRPPRRDSTDK